MKCFLVAESEGAASANGSVEVMASSITEAVEKYLAMGHPFDTDTESGWDASVWVIPPDGEGREVEHPDYEPPNEDPDAVMVCCPECGHKFDCTNPE